MTAHVPGEGDGHRGPGRPVGCLGASGHWLVLFDEGERWEVHRLVRDAQGRWRLEPFASGEGELRGHSLDSQGRLLLRTLDAQAEWRGTRYRLYRLLEDGRLEVVA